jgi:protein SPT2
LKRRKLESPPENKPLTEGDIERLERKKMLMEKLKLKKEKEVALESAGKQPSSFSKGTPNPRHPSKPTSVLRKPPAPAANGGDTKKLSYKEMLARAAKIQEEKKNLAAITHKPRTNVVEKKDWQKKLEARRKNDIGGTSKNPRITSVAETSSAGVTASRGVKEVSKPVVKKAAGVVGLNKRPSATKGKPPEPERAPAPPKRRRSPSPISWRGKSEPSITAAKKKATRTSRHGKSKYDEDEDDDDWIVDDDEEEGGRGGGYGHRYLFCFCSVHIYH